MAMGDPAVMVLVLVAALVVSHGWAYGLGRRRGVRPEAGAEAEAVVAAGPVLVVDNSHSAQEALRALAQDLAAMPDYVATLQAQVEGAMRDAEEGVARVIEEVNAISREAEVSERLTAILCHVQFQDVICQRLGQVNEAMGELGEHVSASIAARGAGEVGPRLTLGQRLEAQQGRYVMQSQRAAYAAVSGGGAVMDEAPRIELF